MIRKHSQPQPHKVHSRFTLPKIENCSTQKLRDPNRIFPELTNQIFQKQQKINSLKNKEKEYVKFVSRNHTPFLDPKSSLKFAKPLFLIKNDPDLENENTKQRNFEIFTKKRNIGNRYLKLNKVALKTEVLVTKARKILRSLSRNKDQDSHHVSSDFDKENGGIESVLVKNKRTLLAMNKLNERIEKIKCETGLLDRQEWESTCKNIQDVDHGFINDSGSTFKAMKTSIFLKLSLITNLENRI